MSLNRQLKMREQLKQLEARYRADLAFVQDASAKRIAQWLLDSMRHDLKQLEKGIENS